MTSERPATGPGDVTAPDGTATGPASPPPDRPQTPEEIARAKAEYNRRRLDEMFANLEKAEPPTESWVGIDAEGNMVGSSPDGADDLQYSLDQILLVKREGALEAIDQLAQQIRDRITGIAAGESALDPEAAAEAIQQLQSAEAALKQLVALLDLHTDGLQAHHGNLVREGLIATDSKARAEYAKGIQDFLLDFGSLMADLASIGDFAESLKESADNWASGKVPEEAVNRLEKVLAADGIYESLKDMESALNTLIAQAGPDVDAVPMFNDLFGVAPWFDEQTGGNPLWAAQTVKSDISDLLNLYADYRKGGLKKLNVRTVGQLVTRVFKSWAEWEQALREQQIKDLTASIAAVDAVLPTPFLPFLATNEEKHLALDRLEAVREARLALHAALGLAAPGVAAADWPAVPHGLTVDQLLVLLADLAATTNLAIDGGPSDAVTHATVEDFDAAIGVTELTRSDVIRRQQVLTSRAAGLDYFDQREEELLGDQAAISHDLVEARDKRGRVDFQWAARTPQLPRSPGGRPSYRHGYPPPLVRESPAQLDEQILNLKADYASNTEKLDDLRRDRAILQGELQELPILAAEQAALDARLEDLRRERDAQAITDAIAEVVAEEEAKGDAALAEVNEAASSFFSGRWLIAAIIAGIVVAALLGFAFLGGGDDASEGVPAAPADSQPADSQPAGGGAEQPAPSTEARTPDGQVPELPAGWVAPPPFDRADTDVEDPTVRWSSGGALWAWNVWQEPELISELEEVDADFAVSQLTTIPAGTAIPNELVISVDCSSDPCTYSTIQGAVAGDVDRRVTVPLTLNGLELTGDYVPAPGSTATPTAADQACTRAGTYRLEVTDLTVINNRLVPDFIRGERTLTTTCREGGPGGPIEYVLNETIEIHGRYLFRGSFADQ